MDIDRLYATLVDIIALPSTSGHEEQVRAYLERRMATLGFSTSIDASGNLIATLDGEGKPILLNAHMDRVPPGLGHTPVLRNGILYSDGTTNLGADDAAGIAVILETIQRIREQHLPHPPLVIVFTVQEEAGMCGANGFDGSQWNVYDGIVFDNAFEAGVVVSQGAAYEAFDVKITGQTGHPGKDLSHTVNAIEIFRHAALPTGSFDNDQTRIILGRVSGGSARNAIPALVTAEGELRSFAPLGTRQHHMYQIRRAFEDTTLRFGGRVEVTFTTHTQGYSISEDEPLVQVYRRVVEQRGAPFRMQPTFIGSDTSGFRSTMKVFTVSTGVVNEHSTEEYVPLEPLEQLVNDTIQVLQQWGNKAEQ